MARQISLWSKDPSTKVGAVVVADDGQILSQGYNGFPRGVEDTAERLNNREVKYDFVVHAEMNCIFNACLSGVSLKNATMYVYGLPICHKCSPGIIQVGIKRVVMVYPLITRNYSWMTSWNTSSVMFDESGVEYVGYGTNDSTSESWHDDVRASILSRHKQSGEAGCSDCGTEPVYYTNF